MSISKNTYKNYLEFIVKISIVIGAFYFIYKRIVLNNPTHLTNLFYVIKSNIFSDYYIIIILISLSILNWFLDILKWKILVKTIKNISLKESFIQSLSAHTAAIMTPNRIGEYGIKTLYYNKIHQKKVLLLNLIHHMLQMMTTTIFGIVGLLYIYSNFNMDLPHINLYKTGKMVLIILLFLISGKMLYKKKIRNFYWKKIQLFIKNIPKKIILKSVLLSILKYLVFLHQFIYLLYLFHINFSYPEIALILFAFYFISSIIPSLPIFDWLIKGTVAIIVLKLIGVDEAVAITITTIMWLLNFAFPAIIGSIYILKYKKQDYLYKK